MKRKEIIFFLSAIAIMASVAGCSKPASQAPVDIETTENNENIENTDAGIDDEANESGKALFGRLTINFDPETISFKHEYSPGYDGMSLTDKETGSAAGIIWMSTFNPQEKINGIEDAVKYFDGGTQTGEWEQSEKTYTEYYAISTSSDESDAMIYVIPKDYETEGMYMVSFPCLEDTGISKEVFNTITDAFESYDPTIKLPAFEKVEDDLLMMLSAGGEMLPQGHEDAIEAMPADASEGVDSSIQERSTQAEPSVDQ